MINPKINKIYRLAITLSITVFSGVITYSAAMAEGDLYKAGLVFYNQGNYKKSLEYLSRAVKEEPSNAKVIYYFANSLVKTNNVDYAEKYYKKVIQLNPDSTVAGYATQALRDIAGYKSSLKQPLQSRVHRNNEVFNSSNSYISNIIQRGKVIHWQQSSMPLKVFIDKPKYIEHEQYVTNALVKWSSATNNLISFLRISSEEGADIVVLWKEDNPHHEDDLNGYAIPEISGDELKKFVIHLKEFDSKGNILSPNKVALAAMHQIGHSLGILTHSDNKDDLMFKNGNDGKITRRDVSTVNLIYELKPDISNFDGNVDE